MTYNWNKRQGKLNDRLSLTLIYRVAVLILYLFSNFAILGKEPLPLQKEIENLNKNIEKLKETNR